MTAHTAPAPIWSMHMPIHADADRETFNASMPQVKRGCRRDRMSPAPFSTWPRRSESRFLHDALVACG